MTDEIEPKADAIEIEPKADGDAPVESAESAATTPVEPAEKGTMPRRPALGRRPLSVVPIICAVGLLVAGLLTAGVYARWTPTLPGSDATPSPTPTVAPDDTPTTVPSATTQVVTNAEVAVPGTLVYVRDGSLWVQSGTTARQITQPKNGSVASQPAWSPDGLWIFFIDTRITSGNWYSPDNYGAVVGFDLRYPVLCRIHPDGTGAEDMLSSIITQRKLKTFFWIRQPAINPDGGQAAVVSDGPTAPGVQDPMIHFVNLVTRKLGPALPLRENSSLGLSDPAYSPDGSLLAYVMEARSGKYGAPSIWIYSNVKKTARVLASRYRSPSWSPDGKYMAATRVSGDRLDVVVLDASTGKQVGQVTTDGSSWAPVWSPAGDQLVYMHLTDNNVGLYMVHISGPATSPTFSIEPHLTEYSGLDGGSPAAWYIPGLRPSASATPAATDTSAPTASSSATDSTAPSSNPSPSASAS